VLLLGRPRDEVRAKENAVSSGRAAIVGVAGPIQVKVACEIKGALGIMKVGVNYAFQIPKDSFGDCPMNGSRLVHVLAELIDRIRDVRASESGILEGTNNVEIFGWIGQHITIKLGHFGASNAGNSVWLGVCYSNMVDEVLNVFGLPEMESD